MTKKELRKKYLDSLERLGFLDLVLRSSDLRTRYFEFVSNHSELLKGRSVVSFYPFQSEPQINIEREEHDEGYRVAYVRIEDWEQRRMTAREARRDTPDLWEEYALGKGPTIYQPKGSQPEVAAKDIALILVPGLAFTAGGGRLGRGAGFYDRFLKTHPTALRVGIAFHEQMSSRLPSDPWDEPVDIVLTDQGVFRTKAYGEWRNHGRVESRDSSS